MNFIIFYYYFLTLVVSKLMKANMILFARFFNFVCNFNDLGPSKLQHRNPHKIFSNTLESNL